jgi:hypothetical protein
MLKRLALIAAAVAGLVFLRNKARQQQAEQDLWNQATDDVTAEAPASQAPAPAAPSPAPAPAADQDTPPATS